jgi:DNA-binding GntR family transcriptional regulator
VNIRQPNEKQIGPLNRQRTFAEEIAQRIILAIANGELQSGERLTENSIAELMQVSRVPVRDALRYLEAIGVLTPNGRRGLKVGDFSAHQVRNLRDLRLSLEHLSLSKAMKAAQQDPARLEPLDAILEEMVLLSGTDDAARLAECDVRFHRTIVSMVEDELLLRLWSNLEAHMIILTCRDWHQQRDKVGEVDLHRKLRDFMANGKPTEISAILEDHIR